MSPAPLAASSNLRLVLRGRADRGWCFGASGRSGVAGGGCEKPGLSLVLLLLGFPVYWLIQRKAKRTRGAEPA